PEDIPARALYPPPKKALATLRSSGSSYENPRFLRDGRILVDKSTPRGDGSYASDLFIWDSEHHSVARVTHDASVSFADPTPDGARAYATRCRRGWCDLVSVDLSTGGVSVLAEGSPTRSFYRPRSRPGGADAIVSIHDDAGWRLAIFDGAARTLRPLDLGDPANRYDASWVSSTQIVDVSEHGGVPNLETFSVGSLRPAPLTSVTGAAVAPEPQPHSNAVWFLSLYSGGYDLRRVNDTPPASRSVAVLPSSLAPAAPPVPSSVPAAFRTNATSESMAFALTPQLFRWIPQPTADADGGAAGLTLSTRDLIGRGELLGSFQAGDASEWRGASVTGTWHGWLPGIRVQGFVAGQRLSDSRSPIVGALAAGDSAARRLDTRLAGAELSVDQTFAFDAWSARYRIGGSAAQLRDVPPNDLPTTGSRAFGFGDAGIGLIQRGDGINVAESLGGNVTAGRTFGASYARGAIAAAVGVGGSRVILPFSASATYGRMSDNAPLFERFALGGGPSVVLDRLLLTQRWSMAVLPAETAVGTSAFAYRVNVPVAALVWYWWAGATAFGGDHLDDWHRVIGVEWSQSVPAIVPAGTPAARGQIGLGESLDAPMRHKVRAYVSIVINP
ncbi:MAG: hypothetical protein ACREPM_12090, partial [Gemmatimonadaceae bacterium]